MTRHSLNIPITPEPVVHVGTDAELEDLAPVMFRPKNPGSSCGASSVNSSMEKEPMRIHHMED
jgi:hypothetical protein